MTTFQTNASVVAWDMISSERQRQVTGLGWTAEHDDQYHKGELAFAAAAYALKHEEESIAGSLWPWPEYPFHGDEKRCLAKAGALIMAELERIIRKETNK